MRITKNLLGVMALLLLLASCAARSVSVYQAANHNYKRCHPIR
jgi:hypothetical protein